MIGSQDLMIGLVIALFFFGAKRLPEIAKSVGKSMQEFKKGVSGDGGEDEAAKPATTSPAAAPAAVAVAAPPVTCPGCQAAMEADWKHCPRCGASPESSPGASTHA